LTEHNKSREFVGVPGNDRNTKADDGMHHIDAVGSLGFRLRSAVVLRSMRLRRKRGHSAMKASWLAAQWSKSSVRAAADSSFPLGSTAGSAALSKA